MELLQRRCGAADKMMRFLTILAFLLIGYTFAKESSATEETTVKDVKKDFLADSMNFFPDIFGVKHNGLLHDILTFGGPALVVVLVLLIEACLLKWCLSWWRRKKSQSKDADIEGQKNGTAQSQSKSQPEIETISELRPSVHNKRGNMARAKFVHNPEKEIMRLTPVQHPRETYNSIMKRDQEFREDVVEILSEFAQALGSIEKDLSTLNSHHKKKVKFKLNAG